MKDIVTTRNQVCLRKDELNIIQERSQWYYTNNPIRHKSDVALSDGWKISSLFGKGKRLTEPTVYAHLLQERLETTFSYLVIDVETTGSLENPQFEMIGLLYRNGGDTRRFILRGEPHSVMPVVKRLIEKLNPTVIVGHNLFGFDLPLLSRWLPFESEPKTMRFGADSTEIEVYTYNGYIACADTYLLSRRCDAMGVIKADSFSLKRLSEALGYKRKTPDKYDGTLDYLLEDLESTAMLFDYLIQWFVGMFPFANVSWQSLYEGFGTIIENTMISHLIYHKAPLKEDERADTYVGGYVELLSAGLFESVYKVDVVSLYPNIMIKYITPRWDKGFFRNLVKRLLDKRLENKHKGNYALQYGLKILINSIYGFLGSPKLFLRDISSAERVTEIGRRVVHKMKQVIEKNGGKPIEIDTDGIYFVGDGEKIHHAIQSEIGFETELEHFDRGLFVKKKNYCLWKDGKKILHGNSLRGRRDGSIQRQVLDTILDFYPDIETGILNIIDGILKGDIQDITTDWKSCDDVISTQSLLTTKHRLDLAEKVIAVCRRFDTLPEIESFLAKYGSRQSLKDRLLGVIQPKLFEEVLV